MKDKLKTGIVERPHDKVQPFAVYFQGKIVWFAYTEKEAKLKLKEWQLRNGRTK